MGRVVVVVSSSERRRALRLVLRDAVALLDAARDLVAPAHDQLQVVVGELAPTRGASRQSLRSAATRSLAALVPEGGAWSTNTAAAADRVWRPLTTRVTCSQHGECNVVADATLSQYGSRAAFADNADDLAAR